MSRRQPGELVATFYGANIYASTSVHWPYEAFTGGIGPHSALVTYCESLSGAREAIRAARRHAGLTVRRSKFE